MMKRFVKITGSATSPKKQKKPDITGKMLMPRKSTDKPGVKVLMPKKSTDKPGVRVNMGGKPAIRKYNPKLEPGIKETRRAPGGPTAPKPRGPSKATPLKPQPSTFDRPVRPLPKRKGTPLRKKMF